MKKFIKKGKCRENAVDAFLSRVGERRNNDDDDVGEMMMDKII
jgi:hypothetical protein